MKKRALKILALLIMLGISTPTELPAQCPMCKIGAESNLKDGGTAGRGLNTGILFMLAMPYLLVGTIGFVWYKNRKRDIEEMY